MSDDAGNGHWPHKDRRSGGERRTGEEALAERVNFALRAMIIAASIFLICAIVGGWQIIAHVNDLDQERQARTKANGDVIELTCERDNRQDEVLAKLVQALAAKPPPSALEDAFNRALGQLRQVNCEHLHTAYEAGIDISPDASGP